MDLVNGLVVNGLREHGQEITGTIVFTHKYRLSFRFCLEPMQGFGGQKLDIGTTSLAVIKSYTEFPNKVIAYYTVIACDCVYITWLIK